MNDVTRRDFLEDLENTHPDHVEKKLLLGEYSDWREAVARGWLECRKAKKASRNFWISNAIVFGSLVVAVIATVSQR